MNAIPGGVRPQRGRMPPPMGYRGPMPNRRIHHAASRRARKDRQPKYGFVMTYIAPGLPSAASGSGEPGVCSPAAQMKTAVLAISCAKIGGQSVGARRDREDHVVEKEQQQQLPVMRRKAAAQVVVALLRASVGIRRVRIIVSREGKEPNWLPSLESAGPREISPGVSRTETVV